MICKWWRKIKHVVDEPEPVAPVHLSVSSAGIDMIKKFEGFRAKAYRDVAGIITIGYGTTKGVKWGDVVTKEEAEKLMRSDIAIFSDGVRKAVNVDITQAQFDALVSFAYNVGLGAFNRSTMLKKLNNGDYDGAASELLRWNRAGGRVVAGLKRRREAEKAMFLA
jgi:lysozyme